MAAAAASLKWVDVLETQFDKSWVDLDLLLSQIEEDEDFPDLPGLCKKHASSLASCFSQLAHKSSVVYQNNAKLEAELIHVREELASYRSELDKIREEKGYLTLTLQSALIENHELKTNNSAKEDSLVEIKEKLERKEKTPSKDNKEVYISERLFAENAGLRREIFELESELVGARMDNVYVDKELAGRIQQIQLLASGTPAEVKERLWTQIESEMCLQRAKTIAQICQTRQELKIKRSKTEILEETEIPVVANGHNQEDNVQAKGKQVMVLKNPADDLGMAIIGGSEHNLPIIVSEIFPNSAVYRANKLKAGDIILTVNGIDFSEVSHQEAVTFLSALRGNITFELQAAEAVGEDDPSNLDFRFYRIFEPEQQSHPESGSPRTKSEVCTPPGRAVISVEHVLPKINVDNRDIPTVHLSPRRENHPSVPGPISQLTPSLVQGSISQPALRTEEAPAEIITNEFVKSDDSSIKSGNNCSDSQLPNLELLSESSSRESELDGSSSSLKNIERV